MRYTPFDKAFDELSAEDLERLRNTSEGWYVEYKSQLPNTRDLAKSLSSFANQYGGWLFLGVEQTPGSLTAAAFPGIENDKLPEVLESLRNAAKDVVRPQVDYQYRALEGMVETIGLSSNRSVVVVRAPEGSNTPYIHNNGRIYIRIGDSSSPISATDKATFDLLYRRGEDRKSYLKSLIDRSPEVSSAERDTSYLHLSILSDPYQTLGHWYQGTYSEFCAIISSGSIPFDNIFTAPNGFIARQVGMNDRYKRLFTWEFSRNCNSFVTFPIPTLPLQRPNDVETIWEPYSIGEEFRSSLISEGLGGFRILNLNLMLAVVSGIFSQHCRIVGQAKVKGPFYIKARIENVWRTVPFVDLREYMTHVKKFDFPVVQASDLMIPEGTSLDTFIVSPELESVPAKSEMITHDGSVEMWVGIMQALGIPGELLTNNAQALLSVSTREADMYHARLFSA